MLSIDEVWKSENPAVWEQALQRYWHFVIPTNLALEQEMNQLDRETVRAMPPIE